MNHKSPPVRISVSKVAGIAGLHPFIDVFELFEDAIYQDAALRAHDQATLGVSLCTEQEAAVTTVTALASSSVDAVRTLGTSMAGILAERSSTNSLGEVRTLAARAKTLVESALACGAVSSPRKARRLESALRSAVNTEFGTRHEDSALRLYERQTGRRVLESNEHLLLLHFPADPTQPPAPLRRVPLRPRRARPRVARASACDVGCGCHLLRAVDRCRAAVAVERAECEWCVSNAPCPHHSVLSI